MLCQGGIDHRVEAQVEAAGHFVAYERREIANWKLPVVLSGQPVVVVDHGSYRAAYCRRVCGVLADDHVERHLQRPRSADAELQSAATAEDSVGRLAPGDVRRDR